MKENSIYRLVNSLTPISLEEMDGVTLQDRIDTKYIIPKRNLTEIFEHLRNDYSVLEISGQRAFRYLTTYFDTTDFQFYQDHHNRLAGRIKARSRTYVESDLHFFEIKVRNNMRTKKYRERLPDVHSQLSDKQRKKIGSFYRKIRPFYHKDLTALLAPTLVNSYTRVTLVNKARTERCTIDMDLSFQDPENPKKESGVEDIAIIELKQPKLSDADGVAATLRTMRIYPRSISKYVLGLIRLHPGLKHNSFKPLLLSLDHLSCQ